MWGKNDPLWGVATWKDRNKDGANPWTDSEFYELGRSDWSDFILHWEKYGVNKDVGLEIGCGAGRLTAPMARDFVAVHALDVSEGMIEYARKHVSQQNVTFSLVEGNRIPLPDASVTAVFSTHVFQHLNAPEDATAYFREISRVLRNGGSMMIHLPIHAWPVDAPRWVKLPYRLNHSYVRLRASLHRLSISRGKFKPFVVMRSYAIHHLYATLPPLGFDTVEVLIFATRSNNDPHPFVLARKSR